jgi:hypothetical protein
MIFSAHGNLIQPNMIFSAHGNLIQPNIINLSVICSR